MTSDKNLTEGNNYTTGMKVWTAPYFEIIRMDKVKTGVNSNGHVEGSKVGMGSSQTYLSSYAS